jgi:transketolase
VRRQFVRTTEALLGADPRLVVLLGDIGVFGFRKAIQAYPDRVVNIGILEAGTTSFAAGLAKEGMIPVFHTIAPFLVERSYEQLKVDFCYQQLGGNFVSVGASYDYAGLGCTHHCPGDVPSLRNLPGMEIVVPGTAAEFDALFREAYADGRPTYFRLSETANEESRRVVFGKAEVVRRGERATVVAVGPLLDRVLAAARPFDVTVLYYTTVAPFDSLTLQQNLSGSKLLLVEPNYSGALAVDVLEALEDVSFELRCHGVPRRFLTGYGSAEEHDRAIGLTAEGIRAKLARLLGEAP